MSAADESAPTHASALAPGLADVLYRYLGGAISPEVALMQMLCESESAEAVQDAIGIAKTEFANFGEISERDVHALLNVLARVAARHEKGCSHIARMLNSGVDSGEPAKTVQEGLAFTERLFDWSVRQSEEASVALYSLGDPEVLERATTEIVELFQRWEVVGTGSSILQIGCGTGRMEAAFSPLVRDAYGVDVSGEMIARARLRCSSLSNVHLTKTDGRDLSMFADGMFDLVYAVDSFPYLVQAGAALVDVHFREGRRVLKQGGNLAILNYAYRGSLAEHSHAIRDYAEQYGFSIVVGAERPFTLWNGVVWRLIAGSLKPGPE
ncbi:MAG: methyltransferase domain-containing protein [Anaerolineae bacterium]|nr:methyltransferase domain-containing protein [Gemmatimonadaceae bacterium]